MPSFVDVLHEVPTLLGTAPPTALKALSATCRSLRTSFRAQVKAISNAEDASKVCCRAWPRLLMVVCVSGADLDIQLSAQWEYMLGMSLYNACGEGKTAVLIRSCQQPDTALMDLPGQHSAALSAFVDKHRHYAKELKLRGPLVSSRVVRALTQHGGLQFGVYICMRHHNLRQEACLASEALCPT